MVERVLFEDLGMRHGNDVYLRYSIQAFNTQEDLDVLYEAVKELRQEGVI